MSESPEDKLLQIFRRLSSVDQTAVTSFTEFLASRSSVSGETMVVSTSSADMPAGSPAVIEAKEIPQPEFIERPDDEKVVAAIKRLSKTYFMLNKKSMLGETSDLVTQHILHGRDTREVIDQLEEIFSKQYRQLVEPDESADS